MQPLFIPGMYNSSDSRRYFYCNLLQLSYPTIHNVELNRTMLSQRLSMSRSNSLVNIDKGLNIAWNSLLNRIYRLYLLTQCMQN